MRRAVILIVILTVLCVGLGLWMDLSQRRVAGDYLEGTARIRELLLAGNTDDAMAEQAYLYACWEHDAHWLNCFVSHHHTKAVALSMVQLATALEHGWQTEIWQALDALDDALRDVEGSDFPYVENIF